MMRYRYMTSGHASSSEDHRIEKFFCLCWKEIKFLNVFVLPRTLGYTYLGVI
jgi:hypothetical protein